MDTLMLVTAAVILLPVLVALWQFITGQGKPESLEAGVKRAMELSQPVVEKAIRQFAEKSPDEFRRGFKIEVNVQPYDNSRLPPEYLKAFQKEVGNGQPSAMP